MSGKEADKASTKAQEDAIPFTNTEGAGDLILASSPRRETQNINETEPPSTDGAGGATAPPPGTTPLPPFARTYSHPRKSQKPPIIDLDKEDPGDTTKKESRPVTTNLLASNKI